MAAGPSTQAEACKRQCVRHLPSVEEAVREEAVREALREEEGTTSGMPVVAVRRGKALEEIASTSAPQVLPGTWPLEMPVLALSGAVMCTLRLESIDVRVTEIKVMVEQKTGVPQMEQDILLHGCSAPMNDAARLAHYADALFGSPRMYMIRKSAAARSPDRSTLRRLRKELDIARSLEWLGCSLQPQGGVDVEESPLKWTASISGPVDSPYKDGTFNMDIVLPHDFPYRPPRVQFTTKIFHPSVTPMGSVEVPFLHEAWSPVLTLTRLVELIRQELEAPYGHTHGGGLCPGCGNLEAAILSHDHAAFDRRAQEETIAHAMTA